MRRTYFNNSDSCFVLRLFSILIFLFALTNCTKNSGGDGGNRVDAEGTYGILATYEKTRARCSFTDQKNGQYEVNCQAVMVDTVGEEFVPSGLESGLTLNWDLPTKVQGAEIAQSNCSAKQEGLFYQCSVKLAQSIPSDVRFDLRIRQTEKERTETEIVTLPFSAQSFGTVPQLLSYAPIPEEPVAAGTKVAYNVPKLDPFDPDYGKFYSICTQGKRVFFVAASHIYVLEKGIVRLYAGSISPSNVEEYSHRLRVGLPGQGFLNIACTKDKIYISDGMRGRILSTDDAGKVTLVAGARGTVPTSPLGDGGPAPEGHLYGPSGIAIDAKGNLLIADTYHHLVRKVDTAGIITTVAGNGTYGFSGDGGPATSASLKNPMDIATDEKGNIYIADSANLRVRKVDAEGMITTVAGIGVTPATLTGSGDGGSALQAKFLQLTRVKFYNGELFVLEPLWLFKSQLDAASPFRIRRIDRKGIISTLVGPSAKDYTVPSRAVAPDWIPESTFGMGENGEFYFSTSKGSLNVLPVQGSTQVIAGTLPTASPLPQSATGTLMKFSSIEGLAVDSEENIYVLESQKNWIRKIDATGNISVLAGNGTAGTSGDGGLAINARIKANDIALSPSGELYIADYANARVRKVRKDGKIQLVVSTPNYFPTKIAFSLSGTLYLALYGPTNLWYVGILPPGGTLTIKTVGILSQVAEIEAPSDSFVYLLQSSFNIVKFTLADETTDYIFDASFIVNGSALSGNTLYTAGGTVQQIDLDTFKGVHLVGGQVMKDCTGKIEKQIGASNYDKEVRTSLSTLCVASPMAVAVNDTCPAPDGKKLVVFSQQFSQGLNNIIKIKEPCH